MKDRLQRLWDETIPQGGPSPQPDRKAVWRRVEASLGAGEARRFRHGKKFVAVLAAALLFVTTAVAAGYLMPEFNVLSEFFLRDKGGYSESLVNVEPISVSDENYTMTLTSSVADEYQVFYTIEIEAKTERARNYLQQNQQSQESKIIIETSWGTASGGFLYDTREEPYRISGNIMLEPGVNRTVTARIDDMEEGCILEFPVRVIPSIEVEIHADGQGRGNREHQEGGPITLEKARISPLSLTVDFTVPCDEDGFASAYPALFFLWKDGTASTMAQMGLTRFGSSGTGDGHVFQGEYNDRFDSVQDLSNMEALIFSDMAYPLDGGEPYAVDTKELLHPFCIPLGEWVEDSVTNLVPMKALCDGLGIPYEMEEETGSFTMTYKGFTLQFREGEYNFRAVDTDNQVALSEVSAVFQDGELWANMYHYLRYMGLLELYRASESPWPDLRDPESWVVIP